MSDQPRFTLDVDCSERSARLLHLARDCGEFDLQIKKLPVGDYLVAGAVLIERKTYADFAISLADGRLFTQAAALARSPLRPVILLEGPRPDRVPDVHLHSLKGAIASLAVMWRLPVIRAADPEDSLRMLRFIAGQVRKTPLQPLTRLGRKPKRQQSRRLFVLQGLPGVGPALASRLLEHLGSIERVMTADEEELMEVGGVGQRKAGRIRELIRGG